MSDSAVDVVFEALKQMRKGDGVTTPKIEHQLDLLRVFGRRPPYEIYNLIAVGLDEMLPSRAAEAAREALNVKVRRPKDNRAGHAPNGLTQRRQRLAARWEGVDRSLVSDTATETVRRRESEGLRELALWMVARAPRLQANVDTEGQRFVLAHEDTTYIYTRGLLKNIVYSVQIRSLHSGLENVAIALPVELGDARLPDAPWVIYGANYPTKFGMENDRFWLYLTLTRTVHFGETHDVLVELDIYDAPVFTLRTPLDHRERSTMRLQFDKPHPTSLIVNGANAAVDDGGYYVHSWCEFGGSMIETSISWDELDGGVDDEAKPARR